MLKKIRFANPIKQCLDIQGKGYTVTLIATIVAAFTLCIVAAVVQMPIAAVVSGTVGIASIIFFGWWFGTKYLPCEEEDI